MILSDSDNITVQPCSTEEWRYQQAINYYLTVASYFDFTEPSTSTVLFFALLSLIQAGFERCHVSGWKRRTNEWFADSLKCCSMQEAALLYTKVSRFRCSSFFYAAAQKPSSGYLQSNHAKRLRCSTVRYCMHRSYLRLLRCPNPLWNFWISDGSLTAM